MATSIDLARWKRSPSSFVTQVLRNPETGKAFELYEAERIFLDRAFSLTTSGALPFSELVYGAPKKSGKTALAAMAAIYVAVVIGGMNAEIFLFANDYEQSQGRVFTAASRIIEASPLLRGSAKIGADRIVFPATGSFIVACASDYRGAAGSNPSLSVFDELWGYSSESAHRLWDESVPSPARKVSGRLVVSYAGFSGESDLLEKLYTRGLKGEQVAPDLFAQRGMLMSWRHHYSDVPWVSDDWLSEMRESLRPNQYLRMIENRFVTSEESFVSLDDWDKCIDAEARPMLADPSVSIWVGADASTKYDSTAIVCCTFDSKVQKVRLVWHRTFQPSPDDPLNFEATIEKTLTELMRRFWVREIRYDPWQLTAVAQRLVAAGLPMAEFPQSVPNLTEASSNLYELVKGHNLSVYPDDAMRLAISRCVALETSRGWRIAKEKQSHKIDVVIGLAQAALGAVQQGSVPWKPEWTPVDVKPLRDVGSEEPLDYMYCTGEQMADAEDGVILQRGRHNGYPGKYKDWR